MKNILLGVISIFLLAATIFGSTWAWNSLSSSRATVVSLTGTGKVYYQPDLAEVSVSVITKGVDPKVVQTQNDRKMTDIIDYVKSVGVKEEDVKTIGYYLYPEYEQSPEGAVDTLRIAGYTLSQNIVFKVRDLKQTPEIIGVLPDKGANSIDGVSFSLSDEKTEELKAQATEKAVAKAKQELERTQALYGLRRARLVSIGSYPVYSPSLYRNDKLALGMGGDGSESLSPIQPGTGELEVQVSLVYELK